MSMEYLVILLLLLASAIFIEWKYHIRLYHSRKERIIVTLIFFVIGVLWDHLAIWRGHWNFSGQKLLGITIGLMPLEEYLFILIIPFWILTVYKVLDKKLKKEN
jgi:lycopene cyclase domain-containing protein